MSEDKAETTRDRILLSALTLFQVQGMRKTSVDDVARHAGVTRITVYRHFADKKELVRRVFLSIERVFEKGLEELKQDPNASWESVLKNIGHGLSALPTRDAYAGFEELKRLYPDVYAQVQRVRVATLTGIFEHLYTLAEKKRLLRRGVPKPLAQAIFWELVVNFFDNPRFRSLGLSGDELYHAMTDMFLHGILKNEPIGKNTEDP